MSVKKTVHFQNCLGVFQGGGCKAVAFVGAYEEAFNRGVFFSEVAGTSAGSIIAVLIGAGANPEQLHSIMNALDFNKFMGKPMPIKEIKNSRWIKGLNRINCRDDVRNFIRHLGFYSASYISMWINDELQKLLDIKDRPVLFKDLLIPTTVVATDINAQQIKLWDKQSTPEQEVGIAVQTSCSIPFYFQPYERRYVDGGMVSNLPSFLLKPESILNKVLGFGFSSGSILPHVTNGKEFFERVFLTAIDGATDIQLKLQESISIIKIDTGDIKATDFHKMSVENKELLIQNGKNAAQDFFNSESLSMRSNIKNENIANDISENFILLIKANQYSRSEILISDDTAIWVYSLFGLLVKWKKNKTTVKILLKKNIETEEHRKYKIALLEGLGFQVIEKEILPFKGFIFDGDDINGCAIIYNETEELNFYSKYYSCHEDLLLINHLKEKYNQVIGITTPDTKKTELKILELPPEKIIDKLKKVKQYSSSEVKIEFENVDIKKIRFLTDYLKGYKYRLVDTLFSLYSDNNLGLCCPVALELISGQQLIVTPPVLEKHNDVYYIIEGNARVVYASKNGHDEIGAMVVSNVKDKMPSTGNFEIKKVRISDVDKKGIDRYEQFDRANYRRIEQTIRDPKTTLRN